MISLIIPVRNEEKYISQCLDSLLNQDIKEQNEIIVVDGCSTDKTLEVIKKYSENHKNIKVFINKDITTPHGLNQGIRKAKGDIILRFDAHASYPQNYIKQNISWLKKLKADNVGGIIKTRVKNSNLKSESIVSVLSDFFGVGNSKFRIGTKTVIKTETVPFGCFKKETFQNYGLFNEQLTRNQDIELNSRICNGGGSIYLIPEIYSIYYARENFKDLFKNNFLNGFWNVKTIFVTKNFLVFKPRHFIPSFLVGTFLAVFLSGFHLIPVALIMLYFSLILIRSFFLKKKQNSFFYLTLSFLIIHFSYGAGIIFFPIYNIIFYEKNS